MNKVLVLLLALVMTCAMSMLVYAEGGDEQIPIPPFAPELIGVTDTTITIAVAPNCEYLISQVDTGIMSNWLTPSDEELAAGQMTIPYLTPGGGYLVFARDKGDPSVGRPAFYLPIFGDEYTWPCTQVWCPYRITGAVETPNYPKDIEGVFPGYVYVYDHDGNEIAALITEYDGYFNGFVYSHCGPGTYKLVATAQNDPTYRCEATVTLPSYYTMEKYILSKDGKGKSTAPQETQAATQAATQTTTTAATTQAATTQATTQKATQKATEKATTVAETTVAETTVAETTTAQETTTAKEKETKTEAVTEATTEATTENVTEAVTQTAPNQGAQSLWLIVAIISGIAAIIAVIMIIQKIVLKK